VDLLLSNCIVYKRSKLMTEIECTCYKLIFVECSDSDEMASKIVVN